MKARRNGWALAYAVGCYLAGVAGLVYCILFLAGVAVPTTVSAEPRMSWPWALTIDLLLVLAWGVQHSGMARPRFKAWLTRYIPASCERVTYCLAAGITLAGLCLLWQPLPGALWTVESSPLASAIASVSLFGWAFLLAATFAIDHFELFGLAQVWRDFTGTPERPPRFVERSLYRLVRHPIQTGVLIGVWATPRMSVSHFVFAAAMTGYILIGLHFEERALVREFGATYADYMRRVPKLLPRLTGMPRRRSA